MNNLNEKIAVVTGGSRGIGKAIAKRLAKDGALVAVHYGKNNQAADQTVQEIVTSGGRAFAVQANLNSMAGVEHLIEKLDEELLKHTGSASFDILVNNAGIGTQGTIEEATENQFDCLMAINLKAPFFLVQKALSRLRDESSIINISSIEAKIGFPSSIAYGLSKSALNMMTVILAKHLGKRTITVNAIMPGYTKTDMNAALLEDPNLRNFAIEQSVFKRIGNVEDIANTAAFLASSDSRWVTGQILDVSGGFRL
ncbi:SDR family oxidoreductase [Bacillus inaquosorum]|uniref:SDR family oxidoreductase n=1 Tax=Bacillus inaquosorum TaxID=483913 RepID=UPI003D07F88C